MNWVPLLFRRQTALGGDDLRLHAAELFPRTPDGQALDEPLVVLK